MEALRRFAASVAAQKERVLTLGVGWGFDQATNWIINLVVYPILINAYGLLVGGGIMVAGCTVLNLILFKAYDLTKRDWLGIEAVKSLRDEDQSNRIMKIAGWLMKKGDLIALIGLSFIAEPVKVVLYMRRGAGKYNGFSRRDWINFVVSTVINNGWWAVAVWGGLKTFKFFF